jgi:Mrp family chromosome partitioning ATPase
MVPSPTLPAHVRIVIGKGGVGKSTMTAALAVHYAESGLDVLIVELEGRPEIAQAFDSIESLEYEPQRLYTSSQEAHIEARRLTPDDALVEYLGEHGLGRFSKRLVSSGVLDIVASSIPGLRDVLVLGKVKQLANSGDYNVVLVDAPATGHAKTFLTSASGMMNVARSGLVRKQAHDVVDMLSDGERCQVLLVTLPEELPVSETIEAAFFIEDQASVALGPVLCNGMEFAPASLATSARSAAGDVAAALDADLERALDDAAAFQIERANLNEGQLARLRHELPLPVFLLPRLACAAIGLGEIRHLADLLTIEFNANEGNVP